MINKSSWHLSNSWCTAMGDRLSRKEGEWIRAMPQMGLKTVRGLYPVRKIKWTKCWTSSERLAPVVSSQRDLLHGTVDRAVAPDHMPS